MTPAPRRPTFAIIVPTYNEAGDIADTCRTLSDLEPAPDEIIIVDGASTDGTPDVVRRHLVHPMRLIVEPVRTGPATARNVGIAAATSDVVVFVDADVHVPPDFLGRLAPHYADGADSVAVEMLVANRETVYGRYTQASHEYEHGPGRPVHFTQAFSCRRTVAIAAGMFPEGLPGAEDFEFGRRLSRTTNRQVVDRAIVVEHRIPDTLKGFWGQWEWRGKSFPILRHRIHGVSRLSLLAERTAAAAVWILTDDGHHRRSPSDGVRAVLPEPPRLPRRAGVSRAELGPAPRQPDRRIEEPYWIIRAATARDALLSCRYSPPR
jgi:glycosyltransferase involved in cell wall biosynthesis